MSARSHPVNTFESDPISNTVSPSTRVVYGELAVCDDAVTVWGEHSHHHTDATGIAVNTLS
jgi:hypothetical protein